MKMHFRLVSQPGSALSVSTDDPELNSACLDDALDLVAMMFSRMELKPRIDGMTPEIWSELTKKYIDQLEAQLNHMRNLMIDQSNEDPEWIDAIDNAGVLLGVPST